MSWPNGLMYPQYVRKSAMWILFLRKSPYFQNCKNHIFWNVAFTLWTLLFSSRVERECETFSFNLSLSFSEQIKALPISSNYVVHQWVNNECCSRWWYSCTAAHLVNVLVELCAEVKVVVLSPTKAPLPCHLIHLLPLLTLYFSIFKPFTGLVLLSFCASTSLIQLQLSLGIGKSFWAHFCFDFNIQLPTLVGSTKSVLGLIETQAEILEPNICSESPLASLQTWMELDQSSLLCSRLLPRVNCRHPASPQTPPPPKPPSRPPAPQQRLTQPIPYWESGNTSVGYYRRLQQRCYTAPSAIPPS